MSSEVSPLRPMKSGTSARRDAVAGLDGDAFEHEQRLHLVVGLDALDRQRQATALGVDLDDLDQHLLPVLHDLARVLDVVCGELGDVHEALDTRDDLDECAERDGLGDAAVHDVVLVIVVEHLLPRIRLGLLETERDALGARDRCRAP